MIAEALTNSVNHVILYRPYSDCKKLEYYKARFFFALVLLVVRNNREFESRKRHAKGGSKHGALFCHASRSHQRRSPFLTGLMCKPRLLSLILLFTLNCKIRLTKDGWHRFSFIIFYRSFQETRRNCWEKRWRLQLIAAEKSTKFSSTKNPEIRFRLSQTNSFERFCSCNCAEHLPTRRWLKMCERFMD